MAEEGAIKPVVYERVYSGLKDVGKVFEDMEARRVWGRAVVGLDDESGDAAKSRI